MHARMTRSRARAGSSELMASEWLHGSEDELLQRLQEGGRLGGICKRKNASSSWLHPSQSDLEARYFEALRVE